MGREDWKYIAGMVVITAVLLGGPILFGLWFSRAECRRISDNGTKTEYRLIGGCFVEVNGRFIPKENWRGEYEQ